MSSQFQINIIFVAVLFADNITALLLERPSHVWEGFAFVLINL